MPKKDSKLPHKAPGRKSERLSSSELAHSLLQGVQSGDLDFFRTILAQQIASTNKLQLSKKTGIGRRTLYDILDPSIPFNPGLATLSALIRGFNGC